MKAQLQTTLSWGAAGTLKLFKGEAKIITNSSGHYKPSIGVSKKYGEILKKAGVDISGSRLKLYNEDGVLQSNLKLH